MTLLEALYRGKTGFFGELHFNSTEYSHALHDTSAAEQKLLQQHPECRELFAVYREEQMKLVSISEYEQFLLGFRAGAQLMLEMLGPLE